MSRTSTGRLLAKTLFQTAARPNPIIRCAPYFLRPLSQSSAQNADSPSSRTGGKDLLNALYGSSRGEPEGPPATTGQPGSMMTDLSQSLLFDTLNKAQNKPTDIFGTQGTGLDELVPDEEDLLEPYHFHIYSHKHNTHVTVTKPNRDAIISLSCGNIGFKKSRRKHFDAAYQLTAYVLERLTHNGWHKKINNLEVVLRGFGQGREAGVKVLMSQEGKLWRNKVIRVADSTRLKFGGTRSPRPRRL